MGEIGFGAMGMAAMQSMQQQQPQETQQPPAAMTAPESAASMPDVMTPAQAAAILQVAEEDVVAAIEEGDLKACKIGRAYRISKASLEAFLTG